MAARKERPDRSPDHALTRGERRSRRQEAERRRMPQHGKGLGVIVRNALLKRAGAPSRRKRR